MQKKRGGGEQILTLPHTKQLTQTGGKTYISELILYHFFYWNLNILDTTLLMPFWSLLFSQEFSVAVTGKGGKDSTFLLLGWV